MFPLQVLISICKRKSLTSCTSQQQLLYVNKLTEVIKQTVSGNLITSHWDLGKGLGILDSLLWHPRLLEATIRPERTFLIGVFLPSQKSEHQKPVENFPNSLPWEWQGWCRARSLEKKKKKTERRRKKNYLFPAICLLNLKMTVAWEGILEVISEHLIMSDSWPVATFQAGVVCRF